MKRTLSYQWIPAPRLFLSQALRGSELARRIASVGIPEAAARPEADAIALLEVAAEVEHGLMIEYLYTAYSCTDDGVRGILALIARQEMGHLLMVQNLLLMLGAEPYMGRYDQSPQPDNDPFPFVQEPVSLASLAKYTCCEAPAAVAPADQAAFAAAQALAQSSTTFVNRIGALYAKLYWLFMDSDDDVGEWHDFPVDQFKPNHAGKHIAEPADPRLDLQANDGEWGTAGMGLKNIACGSRAAARAAIFQITSQGEGGPSATESHFARFLDIFAGAREAGIVAFAAPTAPTLAPDMPGTIDHPDAVLLVRVSDGAYGLTVLEILLSLTLARSTPEASALRKELIGASRRLMTSWLRRLAPHLMANAPRRAGQPADAPERAAPTFTLDLPMQRDRGSLIEAYARGLDDWQQAIDRLRAAQHPDPVGTWPNELDKLVLARRALLARLRTTP